MKIVELKNDQAKDVRVKLMANGGYCPCAIIKNEDTKCMCKAFKEQKEPGTCHCGLYEKVEKNKQED